MERLDILKQKAKSQQFVENLSDTHFTDIELIVFLRGLNFIPKRSTIVLMAGKQRWSLYTPFPNALNTESSSRPTHT